MKTIDCRNMACPQPVVTVKRALEESPGESLTVLVDGGAPRENVSRFAANRGLMVAEAPVEGGYSLVLSGNGIFPEVGKTNAPVGEGKSIMLVGSDRLGDGPEELGRLLMKNFMITLLDVTELPDRIFFINTGVLLTTAGSEIVEVLEKLENQGCEVFSCGVCLDFFHCKDKLVAGSVTNMFTIAESMLKARSVIRL
ncbi:selenium metabolism protein YedF, putative [Geotalea daltonii FRC-32]|uniref:Selenium metabolism protein YedF, putative n=1 Tax=Geotalea daltonii (strain DSM 22248 / JCM 15807 / FRC-32) TaxID=316067 RepID=B9M589_GEODF|nr:sulfurtransferase-like selenium metabolism protein YedF [Geotalea daltonii]ACM19844.1 selenium metabolism protein YedF, putative [Geotalea daltonii FRC-32]